LVEQAAHNRPAVGSSPTGSTLKKEEVMLTSVWTTVALGVAALGFFVYGLIRHEERLQEMERKITVNQEKFTNR
jgi:hypothetical protein